jgi:hypothetical protein
MDDDFPAHDLTASMMDPIVEGCTVLTWTGARMGIGLNFMVYTANL